MKKFTWKTLLPFLATVILALVLVGCADETDKTKPDHPKGEHPAVEEKKPDHPKTEEAKPEEKTKPEHPEHPK